MRVKAAAPCRGLNEIPELVICAYERKGPAGKNQHFFGLFSVYLAPSGAKYCTKGLAVTKIGEG